MNDGAITQLLFTDTFLIPPDVSSNGPHVARTGERDTGAPSNVNTFDFLLAMIQSLCARQVESQIIGRSEDTFVCSSILCYHLAPFTAGALISIIGWIAAADDSEITFSLQASDEHEIVCEGQIHFAIVPRAHVEKKMQRKREAIKRRELFEGA